MSSSSNGPSANMNLFGLGAEIFNFIVKSFWKEEGKGRNLPWEISGKVKIPNFSRYTILFTLFPEIVEYKVGWVFPTLSRNTIQLCKKSTQDTYEYILHFSLGLLVVFLNTLTCGGSHISIHLEQCFLCLPPLLQLLGLQPSLRPIVPNQNSGLYLVFQT